MESKIKDFRPLAFIFFIIFCISLPEIWTAFRFLISQDGNLALAIITFLAAASGAVIAFARGITEQSIKHQEQILEYIAWVGDIIATIRHMKIQNGNKFGFVRRELLKYNYFIPSYVNQDFGNWVLLIDSYCPQVKIAEPNEYKYYGLMPKHIHSLLSTYKEKHSDFMNRWSLILNGLSIQFAAGNEYEEARKLTEEGMTLAIDALKLYEGATESLLESLTTHHNDLINKFSL